MHFSRNGRRSSAEAPRIAIAVPPVKTLPLTIFIIGRRPATYGCLKAKTASNQVSQKEKVMGKAMNRIRSAFGRNSIIRDERGLSTVEYVIILVLIAAAAISLWVTMGEKLRAKIDGTNQKLDEVTIEGKK